MAGLALTGLLGLLSLASVYDHSWTAGYVLGTTTLLFSWRMLHECAVATGAFLGAVRALEREERMTNPPSKLHQRD